MDTDDDDFMGEIEFDLSPPQQRVVAEAIELASRLEDENSFASLNPLIAIMQWWEREGTPPVGPPARPEERLAAVCREFLRAHATPAGDAPS